MRSLLSASLLGLVASQTGKIDYLPGYANANGYSMFSGYLNVNKTSNRNLFHFTVEGINEAARGNVIFWTNGGPGCSSLSGGLFSEQGPFRPRSSNNGSGLIDLYDNEWTWASFATVVYLEQPAGVGFSYSGNTADYTVGDLRSAQDFWAAIQAWYAVFPQYTKTPLWISGESYGGHYVPSTSAYIIKQNLAWTSDSGYLQIPYAGLMVGNAWTDAPLDNKGAVDQWLGHNVISPDIHDGMVATCNFSVIGPLFRKQRELGSVVAVEETVNGHVLKSHPVLGFKSKNPVFDENKKTFALPTYKGKNCNDWSNDANLAMANIDIYFSLGDICLSPSPLSESKAVSPLGEAGGIPDSNGPGGAPIDYNPCIDILTSTYLNRQDVQEAIYVNASTIPGGRWIGCSSVVNYSYSDLLSSMLPTWQYILTNWPRGRYLVFSGSEDLIVPTPGTLAWLQAFGLPVTTAWHPWLTAQQQTGGWAYAMQGPKGSQLYFSTVRGAGHMAPTTQGSRTLQLISSFVAGQNL